MKCTIWADGSCPGNPGKGGLAYVIVNHSDNDVQTSYSEGYRYTTNNRMELLSIIKALESLKSISVEKILIKSDSTYALNTLSTWIWKWETKNYLGRSNIDLLKRAIVILRHFDKKLNFEWVKGHSNIILNEVCDVMAAKESAKNEVDLLIDSKFEENNVFSIPR